MTNPQQIPLTHWAKSNGNFTLVKVSFTSSCLNPLRVSGFDTTLIAFKISCSCFGRSCSSLSHITPSPVLEFSIKQFFLFHTWTMALSMLHMRGWYWNDDYDVGLFDRPSSSPSSMPDPSLNRLYQSSWLHAAQAYIVHSQTSLIPDMGCIVRFMNCGLLFHFMYFFTFWSFVKPNWLFFCFWIFDLFCY